MVVEKTGETEEIFKRKEEEKLHKDVDNVNPDKGPQPENKPDDYQDEKNESKKIKEEKTQPQEEVENKNLSEDKKEEFVKEKGENDDLDDKKKGEINDEEKNKEPMVKKDNKTDSEEFHTTDEKQNEHEEEKHTPVFDESKNKEYEIPKDSDKAIPADVEEENVRKNLAEQMKTENAIISTRAPGEEDLVLEQGSELEKARSDQRIAFEGHAYKKMSYCFCFWVKRYFVLYNDGSLKYFRDINGNSLDFLKTDSLQLVTKETFEDNKHPFQILMTVNNTEKMMAFDAPDARDAWISKLSESIKDKKSEINKV